VKCVLGLGINLPLADCGEVEPEGADTEDPRDFHPGELGDVEAEKSADEGDDD
jgi:hypothetical protein